MPLSLGIPGDGGGVVHILWLESYVNLLNSLGTSLMETDSFNNTSKQRLKIFLFFSALNLTAIVTELKLSPKYSIS